jgi:hypothetical protein
VPAAAGPPGERAQSPFVIMAAVVDSSAAGGDGGASGGAIGVVTRRLLCRRPAPGSHCNDIHECAWREQLCCVVLCAAESRSARWRQVLLAGRHLLMLVARDFCLSSPVCLATSFANEARSAIGARPPTSIVVCSGAPTGQTTATTTTTTTGQLLIERNNYGRPA